MTGTKETGTYRSASRSIRTAQKKRKYAKTTFAFRYSLIQELWLSKADFFKRICETAEIKTENIRRKIYLASLIFHPHFYSRQQNDTCYYYHGSEYFFQSDFLFKKKEAPEHAPYNRCGLIRSCKRQRYHFQDLLP